MQHTIPEKIYNEILNAIPEVNDIVKPLFYRDFLFNMHDIIKGGSLGISLVCLRDAYFRLDTSKISLHSAYIQRLFYERYHSEAPLNIDSILFAKHHLDYIPLNLYSFQENIADFIIKYNSLDNIFGDWKNEPKNKEQLRRKNVASKAAKVGLFLKDEQLKSKFTAVVFELVEDKYWQQAIKYRNTWVHEKPPIIEGLGIQHNRESRINIEDKKRSFGFGGSSKPDYTIDELFQICTKAIETGAKVMNEIISIIDKDEETIRENIQFI